MLKKLLALTLIPAAFAHAEILIGEPAALVQQILQVQTTNESCPASDIIYATGGSHVSTSCSLSLYKLGLHNILPSGGSIVGVLNTQDGAISFNGVRQEDGSLKVNLFARRDSGLEERDLIQKVRAGLTLNLIYQGPQIPQ